MKPPQKRWVRHARTGDRGYIVQHNGRLAVRLDRTGDGTLIAYREGDWTEDTAKLALSAQQIARIAFAADRELCLVKGMPRAKHREWINLTQERRLAWTKGPPADGPRTKLYQAIMNSMKDVPVE